MGSTSTVTFSCSRVGVDNSRRLSLLLHLKQAPGERPVSPPLAAARVVISVVLFLVAVVGKVSGWKECLVSPQDAWKEATKRTPALRMRYDYERRYTCSNEKGA